MDVNELRERIEATAPSDVESAIDVAAVGYGSCLGCLTALYSAGVPEVIRTVDSLFPPLPDLATAA